MKDAEVAVTQEQGAEFRFQGYEVSINSVC
ncbi:hypothetical protein EYF80_067812 [Liparis tanakae]|uniref:Uncharacterized protein n=1 Tax=Liparis tanakae TaxID=230148 RepID=A0A4Z2DZX1_9TELE|nr:hypothetical protein EYF80_067812 [Liparis tanakae]